jgi:hypothetical protein
MIPAASTGLMETRSHLHSLPRRLFLLVIALCGCLLAVTPATAQSIDPTLSFYVPQAGSVATPTEGTLATRLFRQCPNNDGNGMLANNARIKIVVRDGGGVGIANIAAANICVLLNGGTAVQGFSGTGADSIIANSTWNTDPLCPDLRCIQADADTDVNGVTYITFTGSNPATPGVGVRDPNRKWGHYDSELPVFVLGTQLSGRLTSASANGTYVLRIKNLDFMEGLGTELNEGEAVTTADWTALVRSIGLAVTPITYWMDFDGSGVVNSLDFNLINVHYGHDCDTPNNP